MATLFNNKKNSKNKYYAQMRYVKWAKCKYVNLDTSSKTTARVRVGEVNRMEKDIKSGIVDIDAVSWSWKMDNEYGITQVIPKSYKDSIKQWLIIKDTNVSQGTHRRYVISMNCFMNVVGENTPISTITNQNIEDFKKFYAKYHTPVGVNINLRGIKAFLRWAYEEGLIKQMPKICMMKEPKEKPKYLTEKNWRSLIEVDALDGFWKDVMRMYVTTGMRLSEALHGYIDGSFLIVPAHLCKARREIEIELNQFQISVIIELQKARDTFIDKGSSLDTFKSKIGKKFTSACKKIGIYVPRKTTLHCLRHTFAVKKYLETRDLYEVCKRLNHDSIKTTQQRYAQFSWSRLEQDFPSLAPKQAKVDKCIPEKCIPNSDKLNNPHRLMPLNAADC